MALVNDIVKVLALPIGSLASWLETTYNIPMSETLEKWNELTGMELSTANGVVSCSEVTAKPVVLRQGDSSSCTHMFTVGSRKGTRCPTRPKNGATVCSAHKKKKSSSNRAEEDVSEPSTSAQSADEEDVVRAEPPTKKKPASKKPAKKTTKKTTKKTKSDDEAEIANDVVQANASDDDEVPSPKRSKKKTVKKSSGPKSDKHAKSMFDSSDFSDSEPDSD